MIDVAPGQLWWSSRTERLFLVVAVHPPACDSLSPSVDVMAYKPSYTWGDTYAIEWFNAHWQCLSQP